MAIKIGSILRSRCPHCDTGPVYQGILEVHQRCPSCNYDFHPEPGFYLGAMISSYFVGALSAIPTLLAVKFLADELMPWLILLPSLQIAITMPIILRYSRVIWLHVEYMITNRLDGVSR